MALRLRKPGPNAEVVIAYTGAVAPEAIEAVGLLGESRRDIGLLAARGWVLAGLRAFDAFPMTHHIECVATLLRDPA